jgi:hypothetical protein
MYTCSDGFVGDEERILGFVEQERARPVSSPSGSASVNRYLIEGLAGWVRVADGVPRDAGAAEQADRFFTLIDARCLSTRRSTERLAGRGRLSEKPRPVTGRRSTVARYTSARARVPPAVLAPGPRIPIAPVPAAPRARRAAPVRARTASPISRRDATASLACAAVFRQRSRTCDGVCRLAVHLVRGGGRARWRNGKPKRVNQPVPMPGRPVRRSLPAWQPDDCLIFPANPPGRAVSVRELAPHPAPSRAKFPSVNEGGSMQQVESAVTSGSSMSACVNRRRSKLEVEEGMPLQAWTGELPGCQSPGRQPGRHPSFHRLGRRACPRCLDGDLPTFQCRQSTSLQLSSINRLAGPRRSARRTTRGRRGRRSAS